ERIGRRPLDVTIPPNTTDEVWLPVRAGGNWWDRDSWRSNAAKSVLYMSMSLDGYIAAPNGVPSSRGRPLGR
ncbi:MAG: hypothetical protein ACRDUA_25020, partial [Micromonosporaceae bacterium]